MFCVGAVVIVSLGIQSTVAQIFRSAVFTAVRIQNSGYQCIADVPSATLRVKSSAQCVAECNARDRCIDLNVIDDGLGGDIGCQLCIAKDPLRYCVQGGCRAYQVSANVRSAGINYRIRPV